MSKRIIITDDDPAIRKILNILLTNEGYDVTVCDGGECLRSQLKENDGDFSLAMLDIKMPGEDGFTLLEFLQSRYPRIPVVMLTAFNDLDTGLKAIRMGAKDYLTKPVTRENLITCIRLILEMSEEERIREERAEAFRHHHEEVEEQLRHSMSTLDSVTRSTLMAFSETIEQKDRYTKGHCRRVSRFSVALGRELGYSADRLEILEGGALLHDIGKIGISEALLNKDTPLTKEEYRTIQMHPVFGDRIVSHIELFQPYRPIIRLHHERLDGTGYPDGLKGDEIPLDVKIVSLADTYDSMTSNRAYRKAFSPEIAIEEIRLFSGSQFEPELVDLFIEKELYALPDLD